MRIMSKPHSYFPEIDEYFLDSSLAQHVMASQGSSLDSFNISSQPLGSMSMLTCLDFIEKFQGLPDKEVKFSGNGKEGLLNSLSFILLLIACKQIKFYPHLLTLIKEHFFRPGVFGDYEPSRRNRVLGICRNIEIQLINSCSNNEEFLHGFHHILNKIAPGEDLEAEAIVEIIRKKFNIDCGKMELCNFKASCWILGMQKKVYLLQQSSNYIIVTANTSTQPTRVINESGVDNRLESERSIQDFAQQIIVQASEQSTPKFKDNQESVRYRKKSHKNSFGGDFQITGYKQLANLLNKSQAEGINRNEEPKNKKVFSLKFQMQEMSNLEGDDPPKGQNLEYMGNHSNRESINIAKNQFQMRGSNIEGNQSRFRGQRGDGYQKPDRKRNITSSQILEISNQICGQNIVDPRNENSAAHQQRLQGYNEVNPNSLNSNPKQNFKLSFSKKDSKNFVIKDTQYIAQSEIDAKQNKVKNDFPLTGIHPKHAPSTNLLYEGEYFRKKESRRSLFIESVIPIQEEVQSSQQEKTEEQSIPQSNVEREKELLCFENEQGPNFERVSQTQSQSQEQSNQNGNEGFNWPTPNQEIGNINGKGYISMFKTKNRKFSYLTQPISLSKNSLFGASELRQSFVEDGNEVIAEEPTTKMNTGLHNQAAYIQNIHRQQQNKNRSQRTPKIHKNSEAVTETKANKRRFQENPISFSQMIVNVTGHEESNFSGHSLKNPNKRQPKVSLCSNTVHFIKSDVMGYPEPEGWTRKEVIYYFGHGCVQANFPSPSRKPERYIIDRAFVSLDQMPTNTPSNLLRIQSQPFNKDSSFYFQGKNKEKSSSISGAQTIGQSYNTEMQDKSKLYSYEGFSQTVERFMSSPSNNIRSTIDTAKHTGVKKQSNNGHSASTNRNKETQPPVFLKNWKTASPQNFTHGPTNGQPIPWTPTLIPPSTLSTINNSFHGILKPTNTTPHAFRAERPADRGIERQRSLTPKALGSRFDYHHSSFSPQHNQTMSYFSTHKQNPHGLKTEVGGMANLDSQVFSNKETICQNYQKEARVLSSHNHLTSHPVLAGISFTHSPSPLGQGKVYPSGREPQLPFFRHQPGYSFHGYTNH